MKKRVVRILSYIGAVLLVLWLVGTTIEAPAADRLSHFIQSLAFAVLVVAFYMIGSIIWRGRRAVPVRTDEE